LATIMKCPRTWILGRDEKSFNIVLLSLMNGIEHETDYKYAG